MNRWGKEGKVPVFSAYGMLVAEKTFKSELTAWEYRDTLPLPSEVGKLNVLIYAPAGGELRFGNFRMVGK